jgi:hypothetical protein
MWDNFSLIATQYVINVQLKDLTHMFGLWISSHKLYKESVFYYVFTLKYMCEFGISLTLKTKHKIEQKYLHAYSLVHLPFYFPTY